MTQPIQPAARRIPGGIRTHIVAGIVFAILYVVLMNVRPFSPWFVPGATLDFAAEIASPGDGTVQVGRAIYGGTSLLPSGQVKIAKSDTPRTVIMKARAVDCEALLFQPIVGSGVMEIRNPRIQDAAGRVLHRFKVERAKPMSREAVESAANGVMRLRLIPNIDVMFETEKPLTVPGDLWPGWGIVLAEFFAAAILFGGFCALLARRFAGAGARIAAAFAAWARSRPKTALLCAALAGVLIACHPVIFLGRSFVAPNNGALTGEDHQ